MHDHGISPIPQNYQIWFAYVKDELPGLRKALDIFLSSGQPFSDDISDDIIKKYFPETGPEMIESVHDVGDRLQEQLDDLMENIAGSLDDTSMYGRTLEVASGKLDQAKGGSSVKVLVDSLVSATRQMKVRNVALEQRLAQTNMEVTRLKDKMDNIRQEALTDPLTGLENRKSFDDNLKRSCAQALEHGTDLSLVFCDIDHFKKFNDVWGHQTGDNVIRLVASTLRNNVKGQDVAARYGGEEFAVILPNTSLDAARFLADQIRIQVETKKLQRKSTGEPLGSVTISLGISRYEPGESLEGFVHRADSCLYAAKRSGRNRVVVETDPEFDLVRDLAEGVA